jgi:DNA-binding response OmpR family regulator
MTGQTILITDDEPTVREVVRRYLEREGYRVLEAADGPGALAQVREQEVDLIVLDLMLPGADGLQITRQLREAASGGEDTPIIMLTARTGEKERIEGLETGADDYVTKPFSPRELVARVRAVLRRAGPAPTLKTEPPIAIADLTIDPGTREVFVGQRKAELTAKEFDLLWFLARHPRQVFSRGQLLDQVWGYDYYGDPSTVTVHVRRLREKVEADPSNPEHILTVWGVGYKFEADK